MKDVCIFNAKYKRKFCQFGHPKENIQYNTDKDVKHTSKEYVNEPVEVKFKVTKILLFLNQNWNFIRPYIVFHIYYLF